MVCMQLPSSASLLRKSGKYKIVTDRPPMQNEAIKLKAKLFTNGHVKPKLDGDIK